MVLWIFQAQVVQVFHKENSSVPKTAKYTSN
jgi:hypothetical protein